MEKTQIPQLASLRERIQQLQNEMKDAKERYRVEKS